MIVMIRMGIIIIINNYWGSLQKKWEKLVFWTKSAVVDFFVLFLLRSIFLNCQTICCKLLWGGIKNVSNSLGNLFNDDDDDYDDFYNGIKECQ